MPMPPRPKSVVRYERLSYLALIADAASMPLNWPTITTYFNKYPVTYPVMIFVIYGLQLSWIWLIARRRQNWARWVSLGVMMVRAFGAVWNSDVHFESLTAATLAHYLIYLTELVALCLLFTGEAEAWFAPQPASGETDSVRTPDVTS